MFLDVARVRQLLGCAIALLLGTNAFAAVFVSADVHKPDHPAVQTVQHLGQLLTTRSKGTMTIQVKASGELGTEAEVLDKLRTGKLDMARVSLGSLAASVPSAKLAGLPYLFRSHDHMWNVLKGDFGWRMEAELQNTGLVLLTFLDSGARDFYSKKPIKSRGDFNGLKLNIQPYQPYKDLVAELGGSPVSLPDENVAEALKSGALDGAENNILAYVRSEHFKSARYLSLDEHTQVPDVVVMSKKTWSSLKPAQQEMLKSASLESGEFMAKLWADQERDALAFAKKNGVTIITKSQMSMTGIESFAINMYSRYVEDPKDLDTVLQIVSTK